MFEASRMERGLAEEFIRELALADEHLIRLEGLIDEHVTEGDLRKTFRRSLGEVMASVATIRIHISRVHPDLDIK
jgi:hypothetical protein